MVFYCPVSTCINLCCSEETSTDVQARMHAIREKEVEQLRDLTEFLATETRYVEQYLDVLRDARDEWLDEYVAPALG